MSSTPPDPSPYDHHEKMLGLQLGQPVRPFQQYLQVPYSETQWQGPSCPRCNSPNIARIYFTWWGGLLGPSMMALTECRYCRLKFNGTTGKDASKAILVYAIATPFICIAITLTMLAVFTMNK